MCDFADLLILYNWKNGYRKGFQFCVVVGTSSSLVIIGYLRRGGTTLTGRILQGWGTLCICLVNEAHVFDYVWDTRGWCTPCRRRQSICNKFADEKYYFKVLRVPETFTSNPFSRNIEFHHTLSSKYVILKRAGLKNILEFAYGAIAWEYNWNNKSRGGQRDRYQRV